MKKRWFSVFIVLLTCFCNCRFSNNLWENANDEFRSPKFTVEFTDPQNGEIIVPNNNLNIAFNNPIEFETVTSKSIEVKKQKIDEESGETIQGTLEIDNLDHSIVTFLPNGFKFASGEYKLIIHNIIKDIYGNKLPGNKEINFEVDYRDLPVKIKSILPGMDENKIVEINRSGVVTIVFNKLMKKFDSNGLDVNERQGNIIAKIDDREIKIEQYWVGGKSYSNRCSFYFSDNIINHEITRQNIISISVNDFVSINDEMFTREDASFYIKFK